MSAIRFLLAAYDHAHPGTQGSYWAYAHRELETGVLDRFYYDVVAPTLRSNPDLQNQKEISGFATVGSEWACWFKRLDAGADLKGRPGRFVIPCAFVRRAELSGCNVDNVFDTAFFLMVKETAPELCPLPPPTDLEIRVPCKLVLRAETLLVDLRLNRSALWSGAEAISRLGNLAANLSTKDNLRAFILPVDTATVRAEFLADTNSPEILRPRKQTVKKSQNQGSENSFSKSCGYLFRAKLFWALIGFIAGILLGFMIGKNFKHIESLLRPTWDQVKAPLKKR